MIKGASELLQKLLLLILLAPAPDFLLLMLLRWNTELVRWPIPDKGEVWDGKNGQNNMFAVRLSNISQVSHR